MKILKIATIGLLGLVAVVALLVFLITSIHPAFGTKPGQALYEQFEATGHFRDGIFFNQMQTDLDMNRKTIVSVLKDYVTGIPNQQPEEPLPVLKTQLEDVLDVPDSVTRVVWFGHSAFLVQIGGKNILLDPMFGDTPAPLSFLGGKRFSDGLPIEIEELPQIDLLILSHDHYDHLDYLSILKLKSKIKQYYVPLGVGGHFLRWGVPEEDVIEMDWWQTIVIDDLQLTCTPSRHFSGRSLTDRNSTLWSSWVIKSSFKSIYFSGDGGYGPHFKEIGDRLGPFDFAMMECGQYDERWGQIHMMPEETAVAAKELGAETFMPIHWGSFVLALHSWNDPVLRVSAKALEIDQPILVPRIGELIDLYQIDDISSDWWQDLL
ncbi:MAG: L-ascorbate metabolism protein UlaG (beta-lactamase superfamily) [Cyclobacteriaceae bacterium]|jgi:L-ascorbate metabolism protein UlaG (beta-lactamase superfamily)